MQTPDTIFIDSPLASVKANVGDVIIDSWKAQKIPKLNIKKDIHGTADMNRKVMVISATVKENEMEIIIYAGKAHYQMTRNSHDYYTSDKLAKVYLNDRTYETKGGIAIPTNGGEPKAFVTPPHYHEFAQTIKTSEKINFTPLEHEIVPLKYEGLGRTITYLGLSQGQIKFVYKEFSGNMIREAYTQEFSFDYKSGIECAYKDAKFIVHSATPTEINLTQTSPF
jgi:hypothetical protein